MKAPLVIPLLLTLAVLLPAGCRRHPACREAPVLPFGQLQEGDLAFRCGQGVFSHAIMSAEEDPRYSHVGVLVKENGAWKVVHAVPGESDFPGDFDRVKAETIEGFFAPDRAFRGCLVHTGLADSTLVARLSREALQLACDSVRFDGSFDLADSTSLYCTELVWMLYRHAGVDLSEGRRRYIDVIGIHADCLLPEHLLSFRNNQIYYSF